VDNVTDTSVGERAENTCLARFSEDLAILRRKGEPAVKHHVRVDLTFSKICFMKQTAMNACTATCL
jgi:hypothetical protein